MSKEADIDIDDDGCGDDAIDDEVIYYSMPKKPVESPWINMRIGNTCDDYVKDKVEFLRGASEFNDILGDNIW